MNFVERPQEVRRRERVVDDQRDLVLARDARDRLDVEHVDLRVSDRLREDRLRVIADRRAERVGFRRVDEGDVDAELRKRVRERAVRAAVERCGGDDVIAGTRDVEQRVDVRRLTARDGERTDAALERRDALFEHVARRVHDPRIDVAEFLQREQARGVFGIVERVRRRLIDRDRARFRVRIARMTAVNGGRIESVLTIWHEVSPKPAGRWPSWRWW
jgi:hypothetical protein